MRENNMNYKDIITIEPGKRGGKPCIRGLRITVYDVLEMLAEGMSQTEIIEDFPELQAEDFAACWTARKKFLPHCFRKTKAASKFMDNAMSKQRFNSVWDAIEDTPGDAA